MELTSGVPYLSPSLTAAQSGPSASDRRDQDLRTAAQGFEAIFLTTLMRNGRSEAFQDELTGSNAVRSSQDMFDMQVGQMLSSKSRLGIAEAVYRQFSSQTARQE